MPIVVTQDVCARVQPNSFSSGSMNALIAYSVPSVMFNITPPTTGSQRLGMFIGSTQPRPCATRGCRNS